MKIVDVSLAGSKSAQLLVCIYPSATPAGLSWSPRRSRLGWESSFPWHSASEELTLKNL